MKQAFFKTLKIALVVLAITLPLILAVTTVKNRGGSPEKKSTITPSQKARPSNTIGYDSQTVMPEAGGGFGVSSGGVTAGMIGRDSGVALMPPITQITETDALENDQRVYETYASFSLVVDDVDAYLKSTKEAAERVSARILTFSKQGTGKQQSGYLEIKVPVASFDAFNGDVLKNVKEVLSQTIVSQDKTGATVSNQETLDDLKKQREEQVRISTTSSSLTIAQQAKRQVEDLDRRIKKLEDQIAALSEKTQYATITVSVQNTKGLYRPLMLDDGSLKSELMLAWQSVSGKLSYFVKIVIWTAVYAVLWFPVLALILAVRYFRNRKKKTA